MSKKEDEEIKEDEEVDEAEGNYREKDLRESGYDNTTCVRCEGDGKPVLQAGDNTVIVYLCPSCEHMWGVNYEKKKIEEIPKELPYYDSLMDKIREEYEDLVA
ncbi:hypothetical protein C9439_03595 [archaeon SCG-AAA382B04]|nr:hypothetical protein C9439_03595 [archaeon SCG-AAA382B04]